MKKILVVLLSSACLGAEATIDRPDVKAFFGTGYASNRWFSYDVKFYSDGDGALFDNVDKFLLSPRYDAPIRKVVLQVQATQAAPKRYLRLWPFARGAEMTTNACDCAVRMVGETNVYEFVSFDFMPDESIDAVRLGMDGSGSSGNWRVAAICVVYGEKTADEDSYLKQFAAELPPPRNFRVDDFGVSELHLVADAVADAAGYRFDVVRLDGVPLTEDVENFAQAPELSVPRWTLASDKANLDRYEGGTIPDARADDGIVALKIDKKGESGDLVWVDVVTDEVVAPIREVSYIAKAGAADKSDRVVVCGRTSSASDEWVVIGETNFLNTMSKRFVTNAVPESLGLKQVKFRFEAEYDSFTGCALDTLRIVYGGNEARVPIETPATCENPCCDLKGLATGRYACKVRAVGSNDYRDSSWSELPPIDLAWSTISVTVPEDVILSAAAGKLTIAWNRVAKADHYLVTIMSADDPDVIVAQDLKVQVAAVTVPVPSVGEYSVTVTAVSPGGKSRATSERVTGFVVLDALGDVRAEATDPTTIRATWDAVALAEGYQVRLLRVCGPETSVERSLGVSENEVTLTDLDSAGCYQVQVIPLPSDDLAVAVVSDCIDLASERFRLTGAVPISSLTKGVYAESFASLSNILKETSEIRKIGLDYWQFYKGAGEATKLLAANAASKSTASGVYVCRDTDDDVESFMLGTLAAGTTGCSVGLAFRNDGEAPVAVKGLSFDTIQRSFKANEATYVLEWLVTDGATGIGTEGDWQAVEIPKTAPYVEAPPEGETRYRQAVTVTDGLPSQRIPVGGVLIFRWRHEKVSSGPMMAIDNVRIEFPEMRKGMLMLVR